jgi:hypothetical protein
VQFLLVSITALLAVASASSIDPKASARSSVGVEDLQAQTIVHLRRAVEVNCSGSPVRYELQKALDLLVIQQIRDPKHPPSVPVSGALAVALEGVEANLSRCHDRVGNAIAVGLRGDYAAAAERLSLANAGFCGNALAAEDFGREDLLASLRFLAGDFEAAVTPPLDVESPRGELSVDVHASRFAVAFAVRAAAYEQLGQVDRAVTSICLARAQAEHPEDSWNYYYPSDPAVWGQVVRAINVLQVRTRAGCAKE